ncbi:hypothethical protein (plasmid) [Ralstonia solanacearum CMR15]|nr:hypothethical protein [Ralstonia solanacearum CMR15]
MLRIRCSADVRYDAICEDPTLPHLDFLADSQKRGNQSEGQKPYRYIVFVTKFENLAFRQPAAIEVLALDDQRATEVHARIYEHRPISTSFGCGSETKTYYDVRLHQIPPGPRFT